MNEPDIAVRMRGISKSFGGVQALNDVEVTLYRGEVHALLGENGAGKSTLLKILRGVTTADAGTVEMETGAGVAMIFQETSLVPTLSIAENIFLTREPRRRSGLIDEQECVRQARILMAEFGMDADPCTKVSQLNPGELQLVEIIKAVSRQCRILILDEPTSSLSVPEVESLFAVLHRLRAHGVAMVYVSHRMDEIMRTADRVTILRDGKRVITAPRDQLTLDGIVALMIGSEPSSRESVPLRAALGPRRLELRSVSGVRKPFGIDLTVHRGEVVGVAGQLGSGRSALARLLFGIEPVRSGEVLLDGRALKLANPRDAIASGIAMVPEDRLRQGLIPMHTVAENLALPLLCRRRSFGWLSLSRARRLAEDQVKQMRIRLKSVSSPVRSLSGGNQQKVALARWLATNPSLLILDEPTAGIDIGSKREIAAKIRSLAHAGKAILLISSDLVELLSISDRIVVMAKGRLVTSVLPHQCSQEQLQIVIQSANARD